MRTLALIAVACGASVHTLRAQATANLEAGISTVRYDGFLASGAASLSPAIRWEHPGGRGFVNARGTYLQFESGRHSLDASANASWFTPLAQKWRGELGLSGGASHYANIASFRHGDAEVRLHITGGDRGGWIGATVGRSSFGGAGGTRPVTAVALGMWLLRANATMFASLDRSFVGDTAYTDLRSSARWQRTRLVFEGTVGARIWSRGGGRGVFGEGSATLPLGRQAALVLSAGRYPTDAVSGSIAGRYFTAALRFGRIGFTQRIVRPASAGDPLPPPSPGAGGEAGGGAARLDIHVRQVDVLLTVYAPGATLVEVSGDFTDWQPVPMSRNAADRDSWQATFRITSGVHRINVRRDGGPWTAPEGTTRRADDYGGDVGIFILP